MEGQPLFYGSHIGGFSRDDGLSQCTFQKTPFVALRHVHAKLLYGGGMRGCLRVYDGIPAGAAECRRDLAVDSRGEVPTKIRV